MDGKVKGIASRTPSVWCSDWDWYFYTFGIQCDFNSAITNALVDPLLGYINIWCGVNDIAEGRDSATLSEKWALCERLGHLLKTSVCRAQVHDAGKEKKGELIDSNEKYIAEEIAEESRKGVEKEHCSRCSRSLIIVPIMLIQKGESSCIEVSKEIFYISVKEWSARKAKRLDVYLFDDLVNKLHSTSLSREESTKQCTCIFLLSTYNLLLFYSFTTLCCFFYLMHYN